jgi:hypothetical protein
MAGEGTHREGPQVRRSLPLVVAVTAQIAAIVVLHRLGRAPMLDVPLHDLDGWLARTAAPDAVAAVLRVVALLLAWWLLLSTLVYLGASAIRLPRVVHASRRVTPRASRAWVERALAISVIAGGTLSAPAGAEPSPPPQPAVRTGRADAPPTVVPATPAPAPDPAPAPGPAPAPPVSSVHVVVPGESLWTIAAAHLAAGAGRTADQLTDPEIAPYWVRVCEHNRARLHSGDVDLIHPGEVVELPPL